MASPVEIGPAQSTGFAAAQPAQGDEPPVGVERVACLDQADRDGLPCYLDTSKAANVPVYEHLGFETVDLVPLAKGGPPGWGM